MVNYLFYVGLLKKPLLLNDLSTNIAKEQDYGKFYGTDMVSVRQSHKVGTDEFILDDTKVYVIASDDKPIKVVNEGDGLMLMNNPTDNADLTQEYTYVQQWGIGLLFNRVIGVYKITG